MKIVMAASEALPFIKTGGLADVLGSLPQALVNKGHECTVVLPYYKDIARTDQIRYVTHFYVNLGWRYCYCGIFEAQVEGVKYYFIDNEQYFGRSGCYGYGDDNERFAFYDVAVLEMLSRLKIKPDILHLHDWQAAMIAPLYKAKYQFYPFYENIKIVTTIHNLAYQGKCDPRLLEDTFGLSKQLYDEGACRHEGCLNMLKSALVYSDRISTVSWTYSQEIMGTEFGEGLDPILRMRSHDLWGILNGIDESLYDPSTDKYIAHKYNVETVKDIKKLNKTELQKETGLEICDKPLVGMVTRLTWQKGLDLVLERIDEMMAEGIQLCILGAGDYAYEERLKEKARQYPGQLSLNLKYDPGLSCRIYASCDLFLMPSLFEPCGLSQMMSLRYGTIPVVRETGGLKDSIDAYNEFDNTGNGFRFTKYSGYDMICVLKYALHFYYQKEVWDGLVERAMKTCLNWERSADMYIDMYNTMF